VPDSDLSVSVVVPTYSDDRFDDLSRCVDACLDQTYDDVEVVIVVDGNDALHDDVLDCYGDEPSVVIYATSPHAGPIARANMGGVLASGDVVALTDDDAYPEDDWIAEIVDTYERHDTVAVGGRVAPDWVAGKPFFLPEEFYWLIGVTYKGFPEEEREVRNTFGANLTFRRDAFMRVGGFKLGGLSNAKIQGRETEFCARLQEEYGTGVIYNPEAVVYHLIYDFRTEFRWNLRRAFWQGYSKRGMEKYLPKASGDESAFLGRLVTEFVPGRLHTTVASRSRAEAAQLASLIVLTVAVGFGYLWGLIRWR
jgi:GT2 family glycosyltransferase